MHPLEESERKIIGGGFFCSKTGQPNEGRHSTMNDGYLTKRSDWVGKWNNRYCNLLFHSLYISKNKDEKPYRTINLNEFISVENADTKTKKNHSFVITRYNKNKYYFFAESEYLKVEWMAAISDAIIRYNNKYKHSCTSKIPKVENPNDPNKYINNLGIVKLYSGCKSREHDEINLLTDKQKSVLHHNDLFVYKQFHVEVRHHIRASLTTSHSNYVTLITQKIPFTETVDIKIVVVPKDDLNPLVDPVTYTITPEGDVLRDAHPEIFHLKTASFYNK